MTLSTRRALRARQLEKEDPLVVQIAKKGSEDEENLSMLKSLESEDYKFTPHELKRISGYKTGLSIMTLDTGARLVVRKGVKF